CLDLYLFDARTRRTAAESGLDPIDRLLVSLDLDLDSPVRQVSHVTVHTLHSGLRFREHAEADALHTSTDGDSSRDDHSVVNSTGYERSTVTSTTPTGSSIATNRSSGSCSPEASRSAGRYGRSCSASVTSAISS